jgi:transcriptional regulator with XRE-family HTH domain
MTDNFEVLSKELLQNVDVRVSALENGLRNKISEILWPAALRGGSSKIGQLAAKLGVSPSQVKRLFQLEHGGQLSLGTLVRAADALGFHLELTLRPKVEKESTVNPAEYKYCIVTAEGIRFVGSVQGNGGLLRGEEGLRRLQKSILKATAHEDLTIYEPQPGCVKVYTRASIENVPLAGATCELVS